MDDLRSLHEKRRYGLLVPFDERWTPMLRSLPANDRLRGCLLAGDSGALPEFQSAARMSSPGEDEPLLLHCLCRRGDLAWYRPSGKGWSRAGRFAWRGPQAARRALQTLRWHGFATVQMAIAADGRAVLKDILPVLAPVEVGADVLARFVESGWAMAHAERIAPQPAEFFSPAG